ncbi:MAG: PQQ-binding-like beta-propeller repeat protein [Myxococcota bacterium]
MVRAGAVGGVAGGERRTLPAGAGARKARVLGFALLCVATAFATAATARVPASSTATRVLDAPRFYASPVGEVRWLDVGGGLLLVSDLRLGVAGLRVATGETVWNTSASRGDLDRVERIGERVVLIGAGLEVLERSSGRRLWKRDLGCSGRGDCEERVVHASAEGIAVVAGEGADGRLGLLGLEDGKPRWRSTLRVRDLRAVTVEGGVAYLVESGAARAVELATGRLIDGPPARGPSRVPGAEGRPGLPKGAPAQGRWFSLGGSWLFVAEGAPPVALVVDAAGVVEAAGEVAAGPEGVAGAALEGDTLFVAAGRGVFAHPRVTVEAFSVRVADALGDGGADEASALLQPLRRTGVDWVGLERLEARVAAARAKAFEAALARGEAAEPVKALAQPVASGGLLATPGLAGAAQEVTALVGLHLLEPRRSWAPEEVAALEALGIALAGRFDALPRAGTARENRAAAATAAVRGAVLTVAAALALAGRGESAADLLDEFAGAGLPTEPGVEGLASAAAASALDAALRELRPALRGTDAAARDEAARMLAGVRHAELALVDDPALAQRLAAAAADERGPSAGEVSRLVESLAAALRARAKALGPGLGEPGCAAVCRAIREVCVDRCGGSASACDSPFESCATGCARSGQVSFERGSSAGACF